MLFDGIHIPLTTPFHPDGSLNPRKLAANVERYSRTPAAGMVVLGVNGEPHSLSDAETQEVLASAIAASAPHKVMIAGIARDSVHAALALAGTAAELHYDAIQLRRPAILAPGQLRETLTYFQAIADRSPLPIVLTSAPAQELSLEAIAELAQHPSILALVEGSGRVAQIKQATAAVKRFATVTMVFAAVTGRMQAEPAAGNYVSAASLQGGTAVLPATAPALRTRSRETGFQILSGQTNRILDDLSAGANGAIPRLAAACPQACYEVFAGWKDGDLGLATEKQERLLPAAARLESGLGVPALKYASDLNAYFGGWPRLPLLLPNGHEKTEIETLMHGMQN